MPNFQQTVYVTRGDLSTENRQNARSFGNAGRSSLFPTHNQRDHARTLLKKLFETREATDAILLFTRRSDAEHRATNWADHRVFEVELVGHLYRELRSYLDEVHYTGALPRIDGHAFLVFRHLAQRPETKEEREARIATAIVTADAAKKAPEDQNRKKKGDNKPK